MQVLVQLLVELGEDLNTVLQHVGQLVDRARMEHALLRVLVVEIALQGAEDGDERLEIGRQRLQRPRQPANGVDPATDADAEVRGEDDEAGYAADGSDGFGHSIATRPL
ncbi:hypothetical protein HYQ46_006111 [Verticillium longisporum]|nr:hypothetical protein HYQ46_006111 [Verticillium longisporum]